MTRVCKECLIEKDLSEFVRNAPSKFGRLYICYVCMRVVSKESRTKYGPYKSNGSQSKLRGYSAKAQSKYIFDGQDIKALERDNYACVQCGMTNEEHLARWRCRLTVDHIDGLGTYTTKKLRNNELSNLQTLCLSCHGKKDCLRRKTNPVRVINHTALVDEDSKRITIEDVAKRLGVARETITRWTNEGRLPCESVIKGGYEHRLYNLDEITKFMKKTYYVK